MIRQCLGVGHRGSISCFRLRRTFGTQLAPAVAVQRGEGTVVGSGASHDALFRFEESLHDEGHFATIGAKLPRGESSILLGNAARSYFIRPAADTALRHLQSLSHRRHSPRLQITRMHPSPSQVVGRSCRLVCLATYDHSLGGKW